MNQLTVAVLVAAGAAIGGVAGAAATLAMTDRGERPRISKEAPDPSDEQRAVDSDDSELEPAVDTLRSRLNSLERRVSLLTFAQEHTSPNRAAGDDEETNEQTGSGGEGAADQPKKTVDDPVFEAAVRDVMDQVEYERTAERDARRAEWRSEWSNRWVGSIGEQLQLSEEQQEKVREIMTAHFDEVRALRNRDNPQRPVLRSEWREQMEQLSKRAEEELSGVLDADQKGKYDELDDADKIGGRGSWGRFGRGRERSQGQTPQGRTQ